MLAQIPEPWYAAVCCCRGKYIQYDIEFGVPVRTYDPRLKLFSCSRCKKPERHSLYRCIICTDVFLKDFSHPKWLFQSPCCYACLERDTSRATEIVVRYMGDAGQLNIKPTLKHLYLAILDPDLLSRPLEDFVL